MELEQLQRGDTAYAASDIFNDGGIPGLPADALLARWLTLTCVTAGSSAPGFTITTASSAGPRPITDHVSASLRA